jgi:hypothetical protein
VLNAGAAVRRVFADIRTAAAMPRREIVLSHGEPSEERLLRSFTSRHPRYRVVGSKAVGAALLSLDEFNDVEGYLATRRYARRRVRRAERVGCTYRLFDPEERRTELLNIRTSLPVRQGRPMDEEFIDPDAVFETGPRIEYLGVFKEDALVAYSELEYAGEVVVMSDLFGHGGHLNDGIMFLLVAGVVDHVKRERSGIRYVLYDMYFGAGAGLRAFKTNAGFRPHFVRWTRAARIPGGAGRS